VFSKIYADKKWFPLINIPVISYYGFAGMPPATPTNIARWLLPRMIFNYFVFRFHKCWWQKHNYYLLKNNIFQLKKAINNEQNNCITG
jgi:hypothetical protein